MVFLVAHVSFALFLFFFFFEGNSDEIDAPMALNSAIKSLPSEHEMMFPDVDDAPRDMTDFPDDLDEDDSASYEDLVSIWDEINALTPLGSIQTWPSKPNKKVPVKKEPRFVFNKFSTFPFTFASSDPTLFNLFPIRDDVLFLFQKGGAQRPAW